MFQYYTHNSIMGSKTSKNKKCDNSPTKKEKKNKNNSDFDKQDDDVYNTKDATYVSKPIKIKKTKN